MLESRVMLYEYCSTETYSGFSLGKRIEVVKISMEIEADIPFIHQTPPRICNMVTNVSKYSIKFGKR
jgi:hypothetical protein